MSYERLIQSCCSLKLQLYRQIRYLSYFIASEIGKFGRDLNVLPNGMEQNMAFMIRKKLVLINGMQFMNSGSKSLVQNLPKGKFKYLPQIFQENQLG